MTVAASSDSTVSEAGWGPIGVASRRAVLRVPFAGCRVPWLLEELACRAVPRGLAVCPAVCAVSVGSVPERDCERVFGREEPSRPSFVVFCRCSMIPIELIGWGASEILRPHSRIASDVSCSNVVVG